MSTLTAYLAARDRKADVERQLRDAKADLDLLERCLLDEFATEGVRSKTDATTGISVWINRRIWARAMNPDDRAATAQALQAHGGDLADFARLDFNVNSLSSYFRELAQQRSDDHDPVTDLAALVPDDLRLYIALTEDHTLSARKGST